MTALALPSHEMPKSMPMCANCLVVPTSTLTLDDEDTSHLQQLAECLKSGLQAQIKDRMYRLIVYKQCIVASQVVDYLVCHNLASSRAHAVSICLSLQQHKDIQLWSHVSEKSKPFADDYLFFRFNDGNDNDITPAASIASDDSGDNKTNVAAFGGEEQRTKKLTAFFKRLKRKNSVVELRLTGRLAKIANASDQSPSLGGEFGKLQSLESLHSILSSVSSRQNVLQEHNQDTGSMKNAEFPMMTTMGDQHRQDSLDSLDSFLTSVRGFGSKMKNTQADDGPHSTANATFIQFEIPSGEFSIMDADDDDEEDSTEILDTLTNLQKDLQAFGASIRIAQKENLWEKNSL